MPNPTRHLLGAALLAAAALTATPHARAQPKPYPATFKLQDIATNGTTLHVRVGGSGPAVVLIHGFGDTGDMWTPLAVELARDHRVVVPDLRGMGLSAKPEGGYEKKNQAKDIRGVLDSLGIDQADIVGHDIGVMVSYAYAVAYPAQTTRLVVMDAPQPGIPPWDEVVRNPLLWHFDFYGKDVLRLLQGRERIFLDRFYNDFGGDPSKIDEGTRRHYARLYARRGAMQGALSQFHAFRQDARDNLEASSPAKQRASARCHPWSTRTGPSPLPQPRPQPCNALAVQPAHDAALMAAVAAAHPVVAAQFVQHRAADAPRREGLELHALRRVATFSRLPMDPAGVSHPVGSRPCTSQAASFTLR